MRSVTRCGCGNSVSWEAFYPGESVLDALVVKVCDGAHVRNTSAHIAVGVDMDGIKHVLGILDPGQQ